MIDLLKKIEEFFAATEERFKHHLDAGGAIPAHAVAGNTATPSFADELAEAADVIAELIKLAEEAKEDPGVQALVKEVEALKSQIAAEIEAHGATKAALSVETQEHADTLGKLLDAQSNCRKEVSAHEETKAQLAEVKSKLDAMADDHK